VIVHHQLRRGFFVHKKILSAGKGVGRMWYITLKCLWCDITAMNAHAPNEDKDDDIKDSFHEILERVFDQFPRYHMKILLGYFNAKVGRIFLN
jgi:hypothetical protein